MSDPKNYITTHVRYYAKYDRCWSNQSPYILSIDTSLKTSITAHSHTNSTLECKEVTVCFSHQNQLLTYTLVWLNSPDTAKLTKLTSIRYESFPHFMISKCILTVFCLKKLHNKWLIWVQTELPMVSLMRCYGTAGCIKILYMSFVYSTEFEGPGGALFPVLNIALVKWYQLTEISWKNRAACIVRTAFQGIENDTD